MDSRSLVDTLTRTPEDKKQAFTPACTHAEIHRMAAVLAVEMAAVAGAKPVCICTMDRTRVAAALLAGLYTGIPLILPHTVSAATLAGLAAEMAFAAAVVDRESHDLLPPEVHAIDPAAAAAAAPKRATPDRPAMGADSPWVYLFTGGSTGRPRIWTKTPTNLLAETDYLVGRFAITAADRILATAPPNHIYGLLYAVLVPLFSGASVLAATPAFPHEIVNLLDNDRATILVSLPVHYRSLRGCDLGRHRLRLAFSSAGPLDPADGQAFSASTGAPLYEIYGSTETGGIASRCRQRGETELTVFEPVRVDVEEDGALVASAFISPDLPRDDRGRFRLADRLEVTAAGGLRLKGRSDGIVKVGGKRVDLERVREALKDQAGVSDAVVFSLTGDTGRTTEIVAVVEGRARSTALLAGTRAVLAPEALPRRIKVVDRIPMLATGKYDRQALRSLFE